MGEYIESLIKAFNALLPSQMRNTRVIACTYLIPFISHSVVRLRVSNLPLRH